jgi:hypothetical protein
MPSWRNTITPTVISAATSSRRAAAGQEQRRRAVRGVDGGLAAGGEVVADHDEEQALEVIGERLAGVADDQAADGADDAEREQGAHAARGQAERVDLSPVEGLGLLGHARPPRPV